MNDTFTVKLKYNPKNENLIMLKLLYSLTIRSSVFESMFLTLYSKICDQGAEELKKTYDELIEKSSTEWQLILSKYCDLDVQKQ